MSCSPSLLAPTGSLKPTPMICCWFGSLARKKKRFSSKHAAITDNQVQRGLSRQAKVWKGQTRVNKQDRQDESYCKCRTKCREDGEVRCTNGDGGWTQGEGFNWHTCISELGIAFHSLVHVDLTGTAKCREKVYVAELWTLRRRFFCSPVLALWEPQ